MAIDTSPTTQDALSLIVQNFNNGLDPALQINDVDFVFDAPIVNPDSNVAKNTRLFARPVAVSGKYGRVTIYYNRIDLGAVTDDPVITRGSATKMSDIVPLINAYYGINLVANDYVDDNLPVQGAGITEATLNTKPGSLMFIGGLAFGLQAGATPAIGPRP